MPLPLSVRRLVQLLLAVPALALVAAAGPARADIRLDITSPNVEPIPIAVTPFYGASPQEAQLGQNLAAVIAADLDRSGLFRPIPANAFLQDPASLASTGPRFGDWAAIRTQALVSGVLAAQADGRIRAEFRLWDVAAQAQLVGFGLQTEPTNWRRLAHQVADAIYERITGDKGYFDTRIVYVSESGPATARIKRLAIMDQDGENNRYLTDAGTLVLTPRFSPTSQLITYVAYAGGPPRVYLFNLESGRQELLGDFPGMTFAPRFSPDGNRVIMSLAEGGNTDLWVMDLRTRAKQRLTSDPAIDTSPSFSPDASQIVFESDRGGSQQIYVMSAGGGEARRISFGDGRYGSPVWSPRGDYIAFTKIQGGQFGIGIIRPDGSGERVLSTNFLVEGPTWAPNGRVLMYFSQSQGGPVRLEAADITGRRKWTVPTPEEASDPAWSPLIP